MAENTKETQAYSGIYHIYDKIFKRILMLSTQAVISMINGCFHTDYPLDSKIQYNMSEHVNDALRRTLADAVLTVNGTDSYHFEAQISWDKHIVVRMFEYGYNQAMKRRSGWEDLYFPDPLIVYLDENTENIPDCQTLQIHFGSQGCYRYQVPVLKYLSEDLGSLNQRKMVILIPFQLLRLRKNLQKARTPQNMEALKELVLHDIIGSIRENERLGNITKNDARVLMSLTRKLFQHIYEKYGELEEGGYMEMIEDALVLDIDEIEYEHRKRLEAMQRENEAARRENEAARRENEAAQQEKEAAQREKEAAQQEKKVAQQEKEVAQQEKEVVMEENSKLRKALKLFAVNNDIEKVSRQLGITSEEFAQLLKD